MLTWIERLKHARRAGCPIVGVNTPDPASTVRSIARALNGNSYPTPLVQWDVAQGVLAVNDAGREAADLTGQGDGDITIGQPALFLASCRQYPGRVLADDGVTTEVGGTVVFMHQAQEFWASSAAVPQACWNFRDLFKSDGRMLILLSPEIKPPVMLKDDIVVIDEPLPDDAELTDVVRSCDIAAHGEERLDDETRRRAVEAVRGISNFGAETAASMAMRKEGIDIDHLWECKRVQIELTKGLSVWRGDEDFNAVRGLAFAKESLKRTFAGKRPPNAVVWVDEIEKMLAGAGNSSGGDSSGVSQGILGTLLTEMQNQRARGIIFLGVAGSGKSMLAKAAGREAGVPTIALDANGMKESLVGSSEAAIRNAMKVVGAVSSNNAFWIATANSLENIPVALRRRFCYGVYFFDVPSADERKAIWDYYLTKFDMGRIPRSEWPDDRNWTGAEIQTCVERAWNDGVSLKEAARFFVPVATADPKGLQTLRAEADKRYLSASDGSVYQLQKTGGRGGRALAV